MENGCVLGPVPQGKRKKRLKRFTAASEEAKRAAEERVAHVTSLEKALAAAELNGDKHRSHRCGMHITLLLRTAVCSSRDMVYTRAFLMLHPATLVLSAPPRALSFVFG